MKRALAIWRDGSESKRSRCNATTIDALPDEVLELIFGTLSTVDVVRTATVCKRWLEITVKCVTRVRFVLSARSRLQSLFQIIPSVVLRSRRFPVDLTRYANLESVLLTFDDPHEYDFVSDLERMQLPGSVKSFSVMSNRPCPVRSIPSGLTELKCTISMNDFLDLAPDQTSNLETWFVLTDELLTFAFLDVQGFRSTLKKLTCPFNVLASIMNSAPFTALTSLTIISGTHSSEPWSHHFRFADRESMQPYHIVADAFPALTNLRFGGDINVYANGHPPHELDFYKVIAAREGAVVECACGRGQCCS